MDDTSHCRFCLRAPTDFCPACVSPLCDEHARWHRGNFDVRCTQGGEPMDPGWVQHLIDLPVDDLDRAGVVVGRLGTMRDGRSSVHRCDGCGRVFTVTPAASIDFGLGCLADGCSTYDLERDADIFFEPAFEAGIIRREPLE